MVEKLLCVDSKLIVIWNGENSKRKELKLLLGGSDGSFDSDTLGLRLVCDIGILEVPLLGILLEYTLVT